MAGGAQLLDVLRPTVVAAARSSELAEEWMGRLAEALMEAEETHLSQLARFLDSGNHAITRALNERFAAARDAAYAREDAAAEAEAAAAEAEAAEEEAAAAEAEAFAARAVLPAPAARVPSHATAVTPTAFYSAAVAEPSSWSAQPSVQPAAAGTAGGGGTAGLRGGQRHARRHGGPHQATCGTLVGSCRSGRGCFASQVAIRLLSK